LQEPYSTENWRVLLKDVFQNVDFLQTPTVIPTGDSRVKELRQYGTVRLSDGKNLALFELKLNDNVNLIGNRVGLNELVKKHIDQYRHHGILSIFEQGKEDYRFTFTAKNTEFDEEAGFIDKFTDTKRFTYILGANESCRTPAERFYTLSKIQDKTIEQVEDAFNVEKLSKKFFKEYIAQFDHLVHYLVNKPTYFQGVFNSKESDARNYVKRFMGRLVFLKFIQKKGWLGVPVSESGWENGNFQFLEDQFKQFKHKDVFVSQFLNPLFYEALDVGNRPNDEFQNHGYKIPYLSGGLFDNDSKEDNRVDFPEESLTSLFDFFEMYNFTIDENDLHDKEVGIDPEMLGHIFENLLEDNKDKGAFYTPKEIVRYMCQESLKEYLKTHLEKQKLWPENPEKITETTENIANFVERKETSAILNFDKEFAIALKDVKICDPAIGSGAFPMGLLNEIFTMMKNLHEVSPDIVGEIWGMEKNKWQPNIIKENIIKNSIYGVDIEAGAVDIARLRFWLSLVLEEQEPKPLPHLDYKIVVGNSLVSKLGDTIIDIDWEADVKTQELFASSFIENQKNILNKITEKQIKAFDPNSDDEKLSFEIKILKIDLLINQLQLLVENKGTQTVPSPTDRKFKELNALWLDTQGWKKQIKELEKLKQNKTAELQFFDWRLDFAEVMNPRINENPGFDIVIGNPPYVGEKGNEKIFQDVQKTRLGNEFYTRWMDYFYFFFHQSLNILKTEGNLNFITTNYYFTSTGGVRLRLDLKKRTNILQLIDFNEFKIFENALGQHNAITFLKKEKTTNRYCESKIVLNTIEKISLNVILNQKTDSSKTFNVSQNLLYEGDGNQIRVQGVGELNTGILNIANILEKLKTDSKPMGDVTKILMGLVSRADTVSNAHFLKDKNLSAKKGDGIFVLTKKEIQDLKLPEKDFYKYVRPFFKNSDVSKYYLKEDNDLSVLYFKDEGKPIKLSKEFEKHFKKFEYLLTELKKNFLKNEIAGVFVKRWLDNGNYFVLFNPKEESYFDNLKIVCPYRSKNNIFALSDKPWYASQDVGFILQKEKIYDLKYIIAILNSKLIFQWLYNKGKRKGEMLELYKKPLSDVPIKFLKCDKQNIFISLVENITAQKKLRKNTNNLEQQIDNLVYKLYNLTFEEALIIEPELEERLSKEEYDAIEI